MKDKKIILASAAALIALLIVGGFLTFKKPEKEENKPTPTADAIKFKEEYEKLNGTIRESDGATYNSITIPEDNPIKYVDAKGALEVLKNETAIIYVGADWCPWCRNAVPVLIDAAKDTNMKTIYYLNLDQEKDAFEVQNGKLVKTVNGTDAYYELLDFLKDHLKDYKITQDGKEYDTKEKRIYMPFVIACKNGKVEDTVSGTVSLDEGQTKYDKMTDKQTKEVYKNYVDLIKKVIPDGKCDDDCN